MTREQAIEMGQARGPRGGRGPTTSVRALPALAFLTLLLTPTALAADCLPVSGDRILARDLALADSAFATLPATLVVAYAPAPGQTRVFAPAELTRLAHANRIELPAPREVCFAIPMRALDRAAALASMRRALPPQAEVSIVEMENTPVPEGKVEFPLNGLEPSIQGVRMWRGYVRYGETLRLPVWARAGVSYRLAAVIAATDLRPNIPIEKTALRVEKVEIALDSPQTIATRIEDVAGRIPKRTIAAGAAIPLALLDIPPSIRRGDAVRVEVLSGTAKVQIDAVAEAPARAGDMVELRNPASGKRFFARLESDSRAVIIIVGGGL
ncbi:MAG: flagellar basal body P-ring formation protein FlgA [Acidobacteriota bacterium]|nr:flagellar basal body P-ring formation protein FlgA [Acidobacteriota bacterium]